MGKQISFDTNKEKVIDIIDVLSNYSICFFGHDTLGVCKKTYTDEKDTVHEFYHVSLRCKKKYLSACMTEIMAKNKEGAKIENLFVK